MSVLGNEKGTGETPPKPKKLTRANRFKIMTHPKNKLAKARNSRRK